MNFEEREVFPPKSRKTYQRSIKFDMSYIWDEWSDNEDEVAPRTTISVAKLEQVLLFQFETFIMFTLRWIFS